MASAHHNPLSAALRGIAHEMAKFGVVGAVGFVLTTLLSNVFHFSLGIGPLTSGALATAIAAVASYFANRHWTWAHREDAGLRRGLPMFLMLSVVGLALSLVPLGFSEYVLDLHSKLAFNVAFTLIGTAIGTVWRFWSFRRWVFLEAEPMRSQDAAHEALV